MVKKILHIATILILMLATTGVSISKHYCHGSLISFSLFGKAKSCCDSSCGACHNETAFSKVTDNFEIPTISFEKAKQVELFHSTFYTCLVLDNIIPNISSFKNTHLKAPPPGIEYSVLPEFLEVFRC